MTHLDRVTETSARHSHWVAAGPAGLTVEWDAEIINEVENKLLAWRSLPGSDVVTAGSVNFEAVRGGRSTRSACNLQYAPPAGKAGALVASLFGREPSQTIREDLRRFKQLLEAGEIPRRRPALEESRHASRVLARQGDIRVETVPDPQILNPRDAIIKVTATAICGSDLHLYDGYIPTMQKGDILGHEFMGEVVEVGQRQQRLKVGDRVVVPFTIACGRCFFCKEQLWSLCDNSNPERVDGREAVRLLRRPGCSATRTCTAATPGGQAEYVRVPFADVGPLKVPDTLTDEQVLFLSDIFPTGYMAAENCNIQPGDTVAVWGCGPVGQFAIKSAFLLGAERVIAIDAFAERLALAASPGGRRDAELSRGRRARRARELTGGRGPDACIDAVGLEAHGTTLDALYDRAKTSMFLATDRPHALRQAIIACRKGGTVSIPGVYGGCSTSSRSAPRSPRV